MSGVIDPGTRACLERLIEIAQSDTGQSRRLANFLLAWWNADECGGFDLTDMWGLDYELRRDVLEVFAFVAFNQWYPDNLGFDAEFRRLIRGWRAHLLTRTAPKIE